LATYREKGVTIKLYFMPVLINITRIKFCVPQESDANFRLNTANNGVLF